MKKQFVECIRCKEKLSFSGGRLDSVKCSKCGHFNYGFDFRSTDYKIDETSKTKRTKVEKVQEKVEIQEIRKCPSCGLKQNPGASFCRECGVDLKGVQVAKCPKCGKLYNTDYKHCEVDGSGLKKATVGEEEYARLKDKSEDLHDNLSSELDQNVSDADKNDDTNQLSMGWYKFLIFVLMPLSLLGVLHLAYRIFPYEPLWGAAWIVDAIIGVLVWWGLYNKENWSWKIWLFQIELLVLLRAINNEFVVFVLLLIIINFLLVYPNYLYFKKREHLFKNKLIIQSGQK